MQHRKFSLIDINTCFSTYFTASMSQSYRVILKHFKTFPAAKNNWGIGVRENEEKKTN